MNPEREVYSRERRFPRGGFEINFDLYRRVSEVTGKLVSDTYLDEEGRMKEAGSTTVVRGRMAPTETHTGAMNGVTKSQQKKRKKKLEHVTHLCA